MHLAPTVDSTGERKGKTGWRWMPVAYEQFSGLQIPC